MLVLDYQIDDAPAGVWLPSAERVEEWLSEAARVVGLSEAAEMTLRVVDDAEIRVLNRDFRGKDYATNVLSFPFECEVALEVALLGDVVVAAEVVAAEALAQGKALSAHWTHMVVHGFLHLLGFDHVEEAEALEMEALECEILAALGVGNPYEEQE